MRRPGASTRAPRWSPSRGRRSRPASACGRRQAERLPFRDGWFDRVDDVARRSTSSTARRRSPRRAASCRTTGRIAISTFHPDHFETYWLHPFFPSIKTIDDARFPTPDEMERELAAAGFPRVEMRRLTAENELSREDALARIHGRHISTFDLLDAEEIAEGTARAERELPRADRHAASTAWSSSARRSADGRRGCRRGHRLDSPATPLNRHSEAGKEQR